VRSSHDRFWLGQSSPKKVEKCQNESKWTIKGMENTNDEMEKLKNELQNKINKLVSLFQ